MAVEVPVVVVEDGDEVVVVADALEAAAGLLYCIMHVRSALQYSPAARSR